MQPIIVKGKSLREAISDGLKQLGAVSEKEVKITIIQEAKKGFLGIGAKQAVVEMSAIESNDPVIEAAAIQDTIFKEGNIDNEDISHSKTDSNDSESRDQEYDDEVGDLLDVDYVAEYLISVCEAYLAPATVEVEDLGHQITYAIQTDKPGLIIGKHGKIVNALETLAQVLTHRHVRNRVKVVVNVGDYRERRKQTLERLADRTADEIKRAQQPIFLDPLPASERKIIHNRLAKYKHLTTHSEGKEPHRYLVIAAKKD